MFIVSILLGRYHMFGYRTLIGSLGSWLSKASTELADLVDAGRYLHGRWSGERFSLSYHQIADGLFQSASLKNCSRGIRKRLYPSMRAYQAIDMYIYIYILYIYISVPA